MYEYFQNSFFTYLYSLHRSNILNVAREHIGIYVIIIFLINAAKYTFFDIQSTNLCKRFSRVPNLNNIKNMYALEIFVLNRIYNFYLRLFLEYIRNLERKKQWISFSLIECPHPCFKP